ncbi:MAG: hypothetical protein M9955_16620 [Rhizobiaceae bacterium]|nr:hypothetical protein [Rhizobiaceae bacterium]
MLFGLLTLNRWMLLRALKKAGASSIRALAKALERDYRGRMRMSRSCFGQALSSGWDMDVEAAA